jgi:hypothetical protein
MWTSLTSFGVNNVNMTRLAGWVAVVAGVVHLVVTSLLRGSAWSDIAARGAWNSITLDVTPASLPTAEAFWLTPGSFAVPILLFGSLVLWTGSQGVRVPAAFGWAVAAWGVVVVVLLPMSPGWIFPLIGALIVAGDRRRADAPAVGARR